MESGAAINFHSVHHTCREDEKHFVDSFTMGANGSREVPGELESTPRSLSKTTYAYSTGETYYGGWENNKREGFGTYLYATGDAYSGNWHRNHKSGYGVYIKANHVESYAGEWRQNSRNGRGCLIQKNGTRFIGSFKQDLRHGCGVCVKRTGQVLGEIWRHGQLIHRQYIFLCSDADMVTSRRMRFQSVHDDEDGAQIGDTDEITHELSPNTPDRLQPKSAHLAEERINIDDDHPPMDQSSSSDATSRSHASQALSWTIPDVIILLKYAGLNSLCPRFLDQQVDGLALLSLVTDESCSDPLTLAQLGLTKDSAEYRILLSLVRVITKMKHKCEMASIISYESLSECFRELEINYDDIDFDYECGRGGYGEVYKASWMHRSVACKVFKTRGEGASTPGGTLSKDFWLELNALAKLRHPNITLLLGVCLRPRYCIVTEFVACGSLFDLIHRHREIPNWGVARIISVSKEICIGMSYLHSQGVLHCDLKSSNILITDTWGVKIADFGLSFLFPESSSTTDEDSRQSFSQLTGKIPLGCVGTHHWIAPEVLRGEEYSWGADVYSFGIILWEMIHRKIPYHDLSAAQVIALVGYGGKRLRVSSYCPKQVKTLIYMCLNRDRPNQRPPFITLATELNGLHRLAVLEVEDNLDSFFGSSQVNSGIEHALVKLDKFNHFRGK